MEPEYEIENLFRRYSKSDQKTWYLVKWLGYKQIYNPWIEAELKKNAKEMMEEFDEKFDRHAVIEVLTGPPDIIADMPDQMS
jgi:hypothetical protein